MVEHAVADKELEATPTAGGLIGTAAVLIWC
jgi:hypothetical protein